MFKNATLCFVIFNKSREYKMPIFVVCALTILCYLQKDFPLTNDDEL